MQNLKPALPSLKIWPEGKMRVDAKNAGQNKNGDESGHRPDKRRTKYLLKIVQIWLGIFAETQTDKKKDKSQIYARPKPDILSHNERKERGSGDKRNAKHRCF